MPKHNQVGLVPKPSQVCLVSKSNQVVLVPKPNRVVLVLKPNQEFLAPEPKQGASVRWRSVCYCNSNVVLGTVGDADNQPHEQFSYEGVYANAKCL